LALVPERALAIGAEVVQIFNTNPRTWRTQLRPTDELAALEEGLRQHDLPLFFHSIYLINLASADEALRRRSVIALADALALAAATQARAVVTHIGSRHHQDSATAGARVIESIHNAFALAAQRPADGGAEQESTPAGDFAAPSDDSPPFLLLETTSGSGTTIGGRLDELQALLAALPPRCGLCLDSAHMFAAGYPIHTAAGLEQTVAELRDRRLLERVHLIHLNDSKAPFASTRDRHDNLGDGEFGLEGLGGFVRHPTFRQIPFVLEVPGLDGHGPDAVNIARAKAMRAESTQRGGAAPARRATSKAREAANPPEQPAEPA
jgi:deoxyribonuclease-4